MNDTIYLFIHDTICLSVCNPYTSVDTSRAITRRQKVSHACSRCLIAPCSSHADGTIGLRSPHPLLLSVFSRDVSAQCPTRPRAKGQPPHSLPSLPPHDGHRLLQLLALLPVRNSFAISSSVYRSCATSCVHTRYEAPACCFCRHIHSWPTRPKHCLVYSGARLAKCYVILGKRTHAPSPRLACA